MQCYCVVTVVTKVNFSKTSCQCCVVSSIDDISVSSWICVNIFIWHVIRHVVRHCWVNSECLRCFRMAAPPPFFFFFFFSFSTTQLTLGFVSCTAVKRSAPSTTWPYTDETAFSGGEVRWFFVLFVCFFNLKLILLGEKLLLKNKCRGCCEMVYVYFCQFRTFCV